MENILICAMLNTWLPILKSFLFMIAFLYDLTHYEKFQARVAFPLFFWVNPYWPEPSWVSEQFVVDATTLCNWH